MTYISEVIHCKNTMDALPVVSFGVLGIKTGLRGDTVDAMLNVYQPEKFVSMKVLIGVV